MDTGLSSAPPASLGFAEAAAAANLPVQTNEDGEEEYPGARLEIDEGVLKLETLMENAVDKNFDKLEIWTLRNVLCLPRKGGTQGESGGLERWIRLGGYEVRLLESFHPVLLSAKAELEERQRY